MSLGRRSPILVLAILATFAGGCNRPPPVVPKDYRLPLPSKDELAVLGERRVSLNDFELVRLRHPSLRPAEAWELILASIVLESALNERAGTATRDRSADRLANLLRPLYPPPGTSAEQSETLRVLNSLWKREWGTPKDARAYLNGLIKRSSTELNLPLLRELQAIPPETTETRGENHASPHGRG